jgi:hypothetical protein
MRRSRTTPALLALGAHIVPLNPMAMVDHPGAILPSAVRSGEDHRPVRRKAAVMCDERGSRKSKCDGIRPGKPFFVPVLNESTSDTFPERLLSRRRSPVL